MHFAMNIASTFTELDKLYEGATTKSNQPVEKIFDKPDWEERLNKLSSQELYDRTTDILKTINDIELEYDGFDTEWDTVDIYASIAQNDYVTNTHSGYVSDFIYELDSGAAFEFIRDRLDLLSLEQIKALNMANKDILADLYAKLNEAGAANDSETYMYSIDLFVAENLEALVEIFYNQLRSKYKNDAYEWAEEHLDADEEGRWPEPEDYDY